MYRNGVPLAGLDSVKSTLKSRKILLVHLGHRKIFKEGYFPFLLSSISSSSISPSSLLLYFILFSFSSLFHLFFLHFSFSIIIYFILFSFSSLVYLVFFFFYFSYLFCLLLLLLLSYFPFLLSSTAFRISSSNCSSIVYLLFCCCDRYNHCSLFHLLISPFLDCFFFTSRSFDLFSLFFCLLLILLPSTLSRSVFFSSFFFLLASPRFRSVPDYSISRTTSFRDSTKISGSPSVRRIFPVL
jgi:hypothetical protein